MDWNFQSVKYLDDLVQNYGGRKSWVKKQNSKKVFKRMSMPAALGVFVVLDLSANQYLKVAVPTKKLEIQSWPKLLQVQK